MLFPQDDIKLIVNKHNELRRNVAKGLEGRGVGGGQPKAADMFELVWDPVLAASAQRFVRVVIRLRSTTIDESKYRPRTRFVHVRKLSPF